jgi:hypothetical protein
MLKTSDTPNPSPNPVFSRKTSYLLVIHPPATESPLAHLPSSSFYLNETSIGSSSHKQRSQEFQAPHHPHDAISP